MSTARRAAALLLMLTLASTSSAQDAPDAAPMLHGRLELSLSDAIRMGLENNLGVQVERYGPLIAGLDADAAWGAYDPVLSGGAGYTDAWFPSANPISSGIGGGVRNVELNTTDGFAGIAGQVPLLGTDYSIDFTTEQSGGDSFIQGLDPQYESNFTFTLRTPLLRDLLWNEPWTQVRTTRIQHATSMEDFRKEVMDVVRKIEDAYWQLLSDKEEVRVAEKSLETAQALLDQTETQFEVGVVSKVEVTEATAGVAEREFNLIRAENRYRNQQDVLIDLVLGPGLRATSTLEIEPTDDARTFTPFDVDLQQAVDLAFQHRPELEAARQDVERFDIQKQLAWNQRLPELDVEGSYTILGLAGRDDPSGLEINSGEWNDSIDDNGNTWTVRGVFSIPIGNIEARKTYDRRAFELRRAETQLRQVEQEIILDVRGAARNLKASQEGIESAERATEAAEEQLRAEKIRNEYGESTPFDVLQREEDLVDRENERIAAYRAYWASVTALDRAQGTILRNRNIKIDEVSALR